MHCIWEKTTLHQQVIVKSPALEIFKTQLATVLSNLFQLTCSKQSGWTEQSPEAPSNYNYSDYTIFFMHLDRNYGQEYVFSL